MDQPMDQGANTLKSRLRWPPPAVIKFSGNESYPLILKQGGISTGSRNDLHVPERLLEKSLSYSFSLNENLDKQLNLTRPANVHINMWLKAHHKGSSFTVFTPRLVLMFLQIIRLFLLTFSVLIPTGVFTTGIAMCCATAHCSAENNLHAKKRGNQSVCARPSPS